MTGYGELLLAEFKYGLEPKETFSSFINQGKSRRVFYWLKKDVFPYAYWNYMVCFHEVNVTIVPDFALLQVNGQWFGPKGLSRPSYK